MGKLSFTPIAPQWIAFPAYTEFTIGWRMALAKIINASFGTGMSPLPQHNKKSTKHFFRILVFGITTDGKKMTKI